MVYVIFDLFGNLSDFMQGGAPIIGVVRFYVMMIPTSLTYIMPASLMLAELWCLARLTRNNELTAMRACGVSLMRLMAPLIAVGLFSAIGVTIVNESVGSYCAYWTRQYVREQKADDKMAVHLHGPIPYQSLAGRRTWVVRSYNSQTHELTDIEILQHDDSGRDIYKLTASRGEWGPGVWRFENLAIQMYDEFGNPRGAARLEPSREMTEYAEIPADFANQIKDSEFLSAAELIRFIRTHPLLPPEAVQRTMVDFHSRLALPWGCLVAVLFGVPFGNATGRRGALRGVLLCIALFFSSWVLISIGLWLGKKGLIDAWIGGWGPMLVYTGIGIVMAFRMR